MISSVFAVSALGFLLGMRHATDADHVIAVSTIVTRQRSIRSAGLIGMLWGLGHTLTILAVGASIILFKVTITPAVGLAMEMAVGLMLVVLGVLNLTGAMPSVIARWAPDGSCGTDVPLVDPRPRPLPQTLRERIGVYQVVRPLVVGIVHGLAGSAAVALLVLATMQNPVWAVAYLLVFGAGTVAGMMVTTIAMSAPLALAGARHAQFGGRLAVASGVISVGFGVVMTYKIGVVDGLLTSLMR